MRTIIPLSIALVVTFAVGAAAFAQTPATTTPAQQQAAQQDVTQMRAQYDQLEIEMNQTLAELRELKAKLAAANTTAPGNDTTASDATASSEAAATQPIGSPDTRDIDARIDRLIASQAKLEQKLTDLEAAQAEQTERTRQLAAATAAATTAQLNSPYAYRYNANTPTPDASAPQPTAATYTTYSNGYTSGYYVPPTQPVQTVGPVVYVNPQPSVIYTSPAYVYPGWYGYPHYYRSSYYRSSYYYYPRSSVSVGLGVGGGDSRFFFGFRSGSYHGHRHYHHY